MVVKETHQDENFTSLSKLYNHVSSLTANLEDGTLIDATQNATQDQATNVHKLLQNVNLLLAKQQENINSKKVVGIESEEKNINEDDMTATVANRVTVTFQDYNYGFTVLEDKIYAIKRLN
ncbi:15757_t:CDS:2 [Dentiscutata erythropus]|uniref:15757_t:CDS:1 n=1 Tax=Dentiscutata erythropus TaxID=1348616 RepID=A0A9N9NCH5_9GLOM|nr:15757_t:CDS:2 [Dentiscutata erythropus]